MKNSKFYTEETMDVSGKTCYNGYSRERKELIYQHAPSRDAALSGIKRLYKKITSLQYVPVTAPVIPTVTVKPKKKVTKAVFVLDSSGSMQPIMKQTLVALNKNAETLIEESNKNGQEVRISVIAFSNAGNIQVLRRDVPSDKFIVIGDHEVTPSGMTAMYDAVHKAALCLDNGDSRENEEVTYLVMVLTDGAENASILNLNEFKNIMQRLQNTDLWTFAFMVPPGFRYTITALGIPEGNVSEWTPDRQGVENYTKGTMSGISTYVSNRSLGSTSIKTFYTDLSNVKKEDIRSLDDVSSQFRIIEVKKEDTIRNYVESNTGRKYVPGTAYYMLTKDEKKIQDYKQLLVMEKGKRQVYGGQNARQVLGIPEGVLKVRPGNHSNYDIFVQSNSVNRKLVRGTKLLVKER